MGKSKRSKEYSSDSAASSDSEELVKSKKHKKSSKKSKKHKSKKSKRKRSSSSSSESDAWVEKEAAGSSPPPPADTKHREDWMSADNFFLPTFSKEKKPTKTAAEKVNLAVYDPVTSARELNPYYKTGEGGMPSFQRPKDQDDDDDYYGRRQPSKADNSTSNWRKSRPEETRSREQRSDASHENRRREDYPRDRQPENYPRDRHREEYSRDLSRSRSRSDSRSITPEKPARGMLPAKPPVEEIEETASPSDFLTDEQMNEIGAKMIKAELMGNEKLAAKLKSKLDKAKAFKNSGKSAPKSRDKEQVVLSITNAAGVTRPAQQQQSDRRPQDKKKKNKRVETHVGGERTCYYPDDGKYDIKQMVSYPVFPSRTASILMQISICFSLSVKSSQTEETRTLSSPRRLAKSKTRSRWTWQTSSQTRSGKTSKARIQSVRKLFVNTSVWKKFLIRATNALILPRWTRI